MAIYNKCNLTLNLYYTTHKSTNQEVLNAMKSLLAYIIRANNNFYKSLCFKCDDIEIKISISIFDLKTKEFINKDNKLYMTKSELIQLICSYYEFINEYPSDYAATSLIHNIIFYRLRSDSIAELYNENRNKA